MAKEFWPNGADEYTEDLKPDDYLGGYETSSLVPGNKQRKIRLDKLKPWINRIVESIAALEALTGSEDGEVIRLVGYYAGKPLVIPDYIADEDSTDTPNGGSVIARVEGGNYVWKTIGDIDIRAFGADPLGSTDSSSSFANAIAYIYSLTQSTDVYKSRKTLNLKGGNYKINSGYLTIDSSKIRINGEGAVLDFSGHAGDVDQYLLLTSTGDSSATLSSNLSTLENFHVRGRGQTETTFNRGLAIIAAAKQNSAGITLRNLSISNCYVGSEHLASSYNITYDTCKFFRNYQCVLFTESEDMFERAVFLSSSFANSAIAIECNANDGTIYLYGCSLDYVSESLVVMTQGNMELHGCHVEGEITDDPYFVISGNSTFLAEGGWWLFKPGDTVTATQEFDVSGSNAPGLVTINNVKFSGTALGLPFTLNPEKIDLNNPKPDSSSYLSLGRFKRFYATSDRFFDDGEITSLMWIRDNATSWTDQYTTNVTSLFVETIDSGHAYEGDNYLKLSKSNSGGQLCYLHFAIPLINNRRPTAGLRVKSLSGSTATIFVELKYVTLKPNNTIATDFRPYDIELSRLKGTKNITLSSDYQEASFVLNTRANPEDTHMVMQINLFNVGIGDLAFDDVWFTLV